jgi:hypothetical protein
VGCAHQAKASNTYGQLVLELYLLYQNLIDCIKVPNRPRMLRTLKFIMSVMKARNARSKYADEILRFLIQQHDLLFDGEKERVFYSQFVNMHDNRIDSHIAANLQMKYLVNTY